MTAITAGTLHHAPSSSPSEVRLTLTRSLCLLCFLTLTTATSAQVPTYDVEVVAPFTTTTTLRGTSEAGHLVGDQVVAGLSLPFVARLGAGLRHLPLPAGYVSGTAMDANSAGVVVGAVSSNGFPFDQGEPAIWIPDAGESYRVVIPTQFTVLQGPIGPLGIRGGMCVAINESGAIVGWSRYSGFQGGPPTLFSVSRPPIDLRSFGFGATPRDLSDGGHIVGGGQRLDLTTNTTTSLGVPTPVNGTPFTRVIAFAVNASGESVVAADLASIPTENHLTYLHSDAAGFTRLAPTQLPSRFVGFYDNNDRGDVAASGGILFRTEAALFSSFDPLLDPGSANWSIDLGFLANDRRAFSTATDTAAGISALVQLTPRGVARSTPYGTSCESSIGSLSLSSDRPVGGTVATLRLSGIPAGATLGFHALGVGRIDPGRRLFPALSDCLQLVTLDEVLTFLPSGSMHTRRVHLPVGSLDGQLVHWQSAVVIPGVNAADTLTSNALELLIEAR